MSRDFGSYFEVNFAHPIGSTLRLEHPLVEADSMIALNNTDGSMLIDAVLNPRMGLLKVPNPNSYTAGVYVSGIYYEWFMNEDLEFHAQMMATEHLHGRSSTSLEMISGAEVEVMGIGTLVSAFWSLLAEFATDIDISTPEGLSIPARQRYQQVQALIQYWEKRYEEKAAMLNVGLKKTEQFTLRRVSRLTNRYVPLYRAREIDDPRPPVRVRPPIDPIYPTPYEQEEAAWAASQADVSTEVWDLSNGGWNSMGNSGAP